jgi:YgiT-type zinc finger domain-containing protein
MNCVICKNGETKLEKVTVTLERNGMTFVFKEVPADVCENCGEQYLSEVVTKNLMSLANKSAQNGTEISVQRYSEAS